ncbi:MAG: hypothetical protein EBR91_11590 [Flavobacteriia bacterium]|nr:hypothetical protein [Flavobacteriia bacterium]
MIFFTKLGSSSSKMSITPNDNNNSPLFSSTRNKRPINGDQTLHPINSFFIFISASYKKRG